MNLLDILKSERMFNSFLYFIQIGYSLPEAIYAISNFNDQNVGEIVDLYNAIKKASPPARKNYQQDSKPVCP